MSTSKIQATQAVLHDVLSELNNAADEQLDSILGKINTSLKVPGRLSLGAGLVVNVGSTTLALPNGTNVRLALGDVDVSGLSGSVDFASGTGSGDVQTVGLPTMTESQWYKAGFEIRADKKIYVVFGAIGASEALAGFPNWNEVSLALGYISLQVSGGTFATPSASSLNQLNRAGGGEQLSDHNLLNNRAIANQHPTTSISTTVTNFTDFLRSAEDEVQKALDRLDDYTSIRAYNAALSYRINNVVTQNGSLWRCTVDNTTGSFSESNWSLLANAPSQEVQTVGSGGASGFTMGSITIPTSTSKLLVFVNGIYQIETTHYSVTPPTTVNFTSVLPENAQVVFKLI